MFDGPASCLCDASACNHQVSYHRTMKILLTNNISPSIVGVQSQSQVNESDKLSDDGL